jgi:cytidine deaminase
MPAGELTEQELDALSEAAWGVRRNARNLGETAVGCAVLDDAGTIHIGCNVEHRFRSHDIHAEVAALSSLVAAGATEARAVFVAAERERFTPCGACLDWIFELGDSSCLVVVQRGLSAEPTIYTAAELMPFYPF